MKFARKSIFILSFFVALIFAFYTIYCNFNTLISKYFVTLVNNPMNLANSSENLIDASELNAVLLSNIAKDEKDPEKAKELAEKSINSINENEKFKVYYNLAKTYYEKKQFNETIFYINKAIEFNKECYICYNLRGMVKSDLNLLQDSLNDYNTSLNIKEEAITYFNRHLLYDRLLNLKEKAVADLKSAIKLDNSYIKPKISLFDFYMINNQLSDAKVIFTNITENINSTIPENLAIINILESTLYLMEANFHNSANLLQKSFSILLSSNLPSLNTLEYEIIVIRSLYIIRFLIAKNEIKLAKKCFILAKNVENKYNLILFKNELLAIEKTLNSDIKYK